jgi:hypothetical protein
VRKREREDREQEKRREEREVREEKRESVSEKKRETLGPPLSDREIKNRKIMNIILTSSS